MTYLNRGAVLRSLTTDLNVQIAAGQILPLVLLCQVLKGLAYPVNGVLMGLLDWSWAAGIMWSAQLSCLLTLTGLGRHQMTLSILWTGLAVLFLTQCLGGLLRITILALLSSRARDRATTSSP